MSSISAQIIGINAGASDDIGAKCVDAVCDPNAEASIIALLKGLLKQLQGDGSGSAPVNLAGCLSHEYDTIDVAKQSKGGVTVAHNAITATATSDEIDCRGYNAISVECEVSNITSGNWVVEILGSAISGGTFGNCYQPKDDGDFAQQKTPTLDANGNKTFYFRGVPNFVKIRATRTTDGTLTCRVTPMNL
ncbi:MAG: hypothetical protein K6U11_03690 [bacterium]|nr:hypothetical protein [bacterium]